MKFAVIENNKVVNVIEVESIEIARAVCGNNVFETTQENIAHIGLGFDGTTFEQPPMEEVPE
jgi:hypothetical protein